MKGDDIMAKREVKRKVKRKVKREVKGKVKREVKGKVKGKVKRKVKGKVKRKNVLRITIDIFSGRENPVLELSGSKAREALSRLQPVRKLKRGEKGLPSQPTLGYRGMIIEQIGPLSKKLPRVFRFAHGDIFGPRLAHRAADEAFEDFVCGSTGKPLGMRGIKPEKVLRKEIERFRELRLVWPVEKVRWPLRTTCRCAPLYEPNWWNAQEKAQFIRCRHNDDYANYSSNPDYSDPSGRCPFFRRTDVFSDSWFNIQHLNNCYNYATNYRTDTFAQPGRASSAQYTTLTCAAVKAAAIKDDLINWSTANNRCPTEGHLVALVVGPGWDYHWYRKGRNGRWSHKPGGGAATNLDNSGAIITDPRTADRGSYINFCTFMIVKHGHIKII
jgi:hypothetical protein